MALRGLLLEAGVGRHRLSMLNQVLRDAVEYADVGFNPFQAAEKPSPAPASRGATVHAGPS